MRPVLLVLLLAACAPTELTALTYNVHGLPPQITEDDTTARLAAIGPRLLDFDVVGLQEAFFDDGWDALAAGVDHEVVERQTDLFEQSRAYGSGLAVLSRLDVRRVEFEFFNVCNGVFDDKSDCLASKGFQRAILSLGGSRELHVYNSHLDAGGSDEDIAARSAQVDQLIAAMNTASAGQAILFLGDTNLDGEDPPDAAELTRWLDAADLVDACVHVGCSEPDRIDRVLFRDGDKVDVEVTSWTVGDVVSEWVLDDGSELSDHEPIQVDVTVR